MQNEGNETFLRLLGTLGNMLYNSAINKNKIKTAPDVGSKLEPTITSEPFLLFKMHYLY